MADPMNDPMTDRGTDPGTDLWASLKAATPARIGLDRTGDTLAAKDILAFQLAHARARDAVHTPLDIAALLRDTAPPDAVVVHSRAADRSVYLRRPDLGRQLDPDCRNLVAGPFDAVFILADGLSPVGVQRHAPALLRACLVRLAGWSIAPVVVAVQARVALGDEIGARLDATISVVMIGERPGLTVADSLGVYVTYGPRSGRPDSERNCISNIHPNGLGYEAAADRLVWLMTEARQRRLTGVALKDTSIRQVTDNSTLIE